MLEIVWPTIRTALLSLRSIKLRRLNEIFSHQNFFHAKCSTIVNKFNRIARIEISILYFTFWTHTYYFISYNLQHCRYSKWQQWLHYINTKTEYNILWTVRDKKEISCAKMVHNHAFLIIPELRFLVMQYKFIIYYGRDHA